MCAQTVGHFYFYTQFIRRKKFVEFFSSAVTSLSTVVVAIGAGVGVWGIINLMEGYGGDNPASNAHVR